MINPEAPTVQKQQKLAAQILRYVNGPNGLLARVRQDQSAIRNFINEAKHMSTPNDPIQVFTTQIQANLTAAQAALTTLAAGVTALDTLIQQLQSQIAAGSSTLSQADQALLQQVVTQSATVASTAAGISVAPPGSPSAQPTA